MGPLFMEGCYLLFSSNKLALARHWTAWRRVQYWSNWGFTAGVFLLIFLSNHNNYSIGRCGNDGATVATHHSFPFWPLAATMGLQYEPVPALWWIETGLWEDPWNRALSSPGDHWRHRREPGKRRSTCVASGWRGGYGAVEGWTWLPPQTQDRPASMCISLIYVYKSVLADSCLYVITVYFSCMFFYSQFYYCHHSAENRGKRGPWGSQISS